MKVTTTNATSVKVLDYPKLMVAADGEIVLMCSHGKGVVIRCGNTINPVGQMSECWHMNCFKDYTGTITLENSNDH